MMSTGPFHSTPSVCTLGTAKAPARPQCRLARTRCDSRAESCPCKTQLRQKYRFRGESGEWREREREREREEREEREER